MAQAIKLEKFQEIRHPKGIPDKYALYHAPKSVPESIDEDKTLLIKRKDEDVTI